MQLADGQLEKLCVRKLLVYSSLLYRPHAVLSASLPVFTLLKHFRPAFQELRIFLQGIGLLKQVCLEPDDGMLVGLKLVLFGGYTGLSFAIVVDTGV